jgi:hypothetical protein
MDVPNHSRRRTQPTHKTNTQKGGFFLDVVVEPFATKTSGAFSSIGFADDPEGVERRIRGITAPGDRHHPWRLPFGLAVLMQNCSGQLG